MLRRGIFELSSSALMLTGMNQVLVLWLWRASSPSYSIAPFCQVVPGPMGLHLRGTFVALILIGKKLNIDINCGMLMDIW
jgi:hypothetical protein